jgi:hypothetical protein
MTSVYSCLRFIIVLKLMVGGLWAETIASPPLVSIVSDSMIINILPLTWSSASAVSKERCLSISAVINFSKPCCAGSGITLNTGVIAAPRLGLFWFNPATGSSEVTDTDLPNPGNLTLEKRLSGEWVVVSDDVTKNYSQTR